MFVLEIFINRTNTDPGFFCNEVYVCTAKGGVTAGQIQGISFCAQMQGLVLVDEDGGPVRRAISYMDNRAQKEIKEGLARGIQIDGMNLRKLVRSIMITGAVAAGAKDPVWK